MSEGSLELIDGVDWPGLRPGRRELNGRMGLVRHLGVSWWAGGGQVVKEAQLCASERERSGRAA